MTIRFFDKLGLIGRVYSIIPRLPRLRFKLVTLLVPVDSVRYIEFLYFLKYLEKEEVQGKKILSVSSPHIMAYLLAKKNDVTAINLDPNEKVFFNSNEHLKFQIGDATKLDFSDFSFDVVYSISVIEHIYQGSIQALREMTRVLKPGGLLYITCPIANERTEEWLTDDAYGVQAHVGERVFFQYRFSEADVNTMLDALPDVEIVGKDYYWERKIGSYDSMIANMRKNHHTKNKLLRLLISAWLNIKAGYGLFEKSPRLSFPNDASLGNLQLILRKK